MWPPLDWNRLGPQIKPMQERPAIGAREQCQKKVAIFQVILDAQGVAFDQTNDAALRIVYQLGRGRISIDRAYKELEQYAVKPESETPTGNSASNPGDSGQRGL